MSTHDLTANGNGTSETAPMNPIDGIVAELEDLLAPMEAERAQLLARLNDIDIERVRITDAITALVGKRPAAAAPAAATKKRSKHDWSPSQKVLDDIYAYLARSEEPQSLTAIADGTGVSRGTVSKAIDELRKREQVRFCGQGGTGGANLFGPMNRG